MEITARVEGIFISDHALGGHVDIRYWCREDDRYQATVQVRVFYERKDMSLSDVEEDAIRRGVEICGEIARGAKIETSHGSDLWIAQPKARTGKERITPRKIS